MRFKLWIKTVKMLSGSITQESLSFFGFLGQFSKRCIYYSLKGIDYLEVEIKYANSGVGDALPLTYCKVMIVYHKVSFIANKQVLLSMHMQ